MLKKFLLFFGIFSLFLFSSELFSAEKSSPLKSWKVGVSVRGYTEYPQEEFDAIAAAGFQCVEMSLPGGRRTDEQKLALIKDFKAKCDRAKLEIWSVHIPFGRDLDISSSNPEDHQKMIEETLKLFGWNQYIGAKVFVIHSSSEPIADPDRPERIQICIRTLRDLTAKAKEFGILLAMENLPRTCLANSAKEMNLILSGSGPETNWCFDSNHLLQEKPEEFVQCTNRAPITTHISDYDFIDERHWIPYDGQINWNGVINALVAKGYKGPCIFEGRKRKEGENASYEELFQVWKKLQNEVQAPENVGGIEIPPRTKVDRLKCFWTFGNHEPISMYRRIGKKSTGGIEGNSEWLVKWHHWFDSEECPKFMEDHGLNFIHSRFYKGMGWNFESKDFPRVQQFVKNCHKHHVRVLAYIQFSTIYYEIMKEEYPNIEDWALRAENGMPVPYQGGGYFRWKTCINNPEFEDLLKKMITIALKEGEFDGVMFDNLEAPPCYCARCTQQFREFLGKEKDPLDKFGLPTVKNVRIPSLVKSDQEEIQDPIRQQWYLFRAQKLTDLICRLRLHAKQCKSDAIMSANVWSIRSSDRMGNASINISSLVDGFDLLVDQSSNAPKIEKGGIVHRIHDYKFTEEVDLPVLALCDEDAGRSKEGHYLLPILEDMIFGGIPTDRTIMRADKQMINPDLLAFRAPLLKKIQTMIRTNYKALSAPEYKPVRILYSEESHLFSRQSWGGTFLAEEILLHHHIPYGILITKQNKPLSIPNDCEVLIVPDQRCLSDQELEILLDYARGGGRLIITGKTGDYNSLYGERLVNPLDEGLKGLPQSILRKDEGVPVSALKGNKWTIRSGNDEEKSLLADLDKIWSPKIRIDAPDYVFTRINRDGDNLYVHILNYAGKSVPEGIKITMDGVKKDKVSCSIPMESGEFQPLSSSNGNYWTLPGFREYCLIHFFLSPISMFSQN